MTAPDPKPGERSFSFSRIFSGIRDEIREHSTKATVELSGEIAVDAGIKELRISTPRSAPLTVIGEKRTDVAYELPVESTGPDEETAKNYARKVALREDPLGPVLSLTLTFPEEATQTAKLTIRVPNHLLIRVENAGRISVADVAALELRNTAGETNVIGVMGEVRGSHRTGDLTITGAKSVDLSLASARLKLKGVKESTTLNMRSGECWIGESSGPIDATLANVEFTVVGHTDDKPISKPATRSKHPTNWHLSTNRANSVVTTLAGAGLKEGRMGAAGYSMFQPAVPNTDDKARQINRRVEIFVLAPDASVAGWENGTSRN